MVYEQLLNATYKKCKRRANCGKVPEIRLVDYAKNPTGDYFIIRCQCGIETISDTIENNLKRWNKRR